MSDPVHWADWAQQPDVRIACTQSYHIPWSSGRELPADVYEITEGSEAILYTYEPQRVTCTTCQAIPAFQEVHRADLAYRLSAAKDPEEA